MKTIPHRCTIPLIYHAKSKLQPKKTKIIIFYKLFNRQYWKICYIACFYFATISQDDGSVCGRYFFYLTGNLNNCPSVFVFIRDKIFDANFRLFVDMIGDIRQAFIDRPLLLLIQFRTACGQTGGFSYGIIVLRSLAVAPSCKLMAVWESLRHKSLSSIG